MADMRLTVVPVAATGPDWLPAQLARAGQAWATADSVSMVYEALTAGAAVGILDVPRQRASRISRDVSSFMKFERKFKENGIRFEYLSKIDNELPVTPMMEAFEAAYKNRRAKNGTRA